MTPKNSATSNPTLDTQPTTNNQQPTTNNQQPATSNQQPHTRPHLLPHPHPIGYHFADMNQPVQIENEFVRMEVLPQLGGKVISVVDKVDGYPLLFDYPAELPTRPQYDEPFDDSYYAGWDECFPGVAPCKYPRHPYEGIAVPDHGELWGLPTTAVPTRDGLTVVWYGLRFGYRLTRKLRVEGPTIVAEYTLINLAPFEFRFVWALHSLLAMTAPAPIDVGTVKAFRYSHDADGVDHQVKFDWPMIPDPAVAGGVDASSPASLPTRRGWKLFSADPISGPVVVRYPTRNRSVKIEYTADEGPAAYWGIWITTGGWGGNQNFAIEPTTGRFDQLDRAISDGSAARLAPSGRQDWSVRWTLG